MQLKVNGVYVEPIIEAARQHVVSTANLTLV